MPAFLKYMPYALAVIIGFSFGYPIGHWRGVAAGKEISRTKTLDKAVEINEQKAKIRNNRPNAVGVVKRLRDGSF